MTLPVRFVESEYWNTGYAGSIGGTGTNTEVSLGLDQVFPVTGSAFIGQPTTSRFQKIFIENTGDQAGHMINNASVFFNNVTYPDQVSFAFEASAGDTGDHPTGMPSGYTTGDFITPLGLINATGIPLTGLDTGELLGLWLWQQIPANLPAETGAIMTIGMIGETG